MGEFWRDQKMDIIIETIVSIFNTEGVELVRLNGLIKYLNKISSSSVSLEDVKLIITKLHNAQVIDYSYTLYCPHCHEVSYIVRPIIVEEKMCDTCRKIYKVIPGKTLFNNITSK